MHRLTPLVVVIFLATASTAFAGSFTATAPVTVSYTAASPFPDLGCTNEDLSGQLSAGSLVYKNGEVEPWVATDPTDVTHLVGAWQQDRWNDGGSRGIVTAYSNDSGDSWTRVTTTKSSFCTGGTGGNGGDFQRSTDPWVTISPTNGYVYLMTLSIEDPLLGPDHAMLVMKSIDGGANWGNPTTLIREDNPAVLNDKNSITADPNDSDNVYAVWDRLEFPNAHARAAAVENAFPFTGPVLFSRTTNAGGSWSTPKVIFDTKGHITQTIGNQIVVLPDLNNGTFEGQLIDGFTYRTLKMGGNVFGFDNLVVIRSADHGATWSKSPIFINKILNVGVTDPLTGDPLRTEDIIADFAVDPSNGKLYAVWEDGRFNGSAYDGIVFSQSTDGGFTWSTPIEIDKTPNSGPNGNRQAFLPSVHVLPGGIVGVTYYDFRNNGTGDTSPADPLETDVFAVHCHSSCTNAGNWSETQITTSSFNMRKAPVARGLFVGDYEGLSDTNDGSFDTFLAFYSQANSDTDPATIYSSRIGP